MIIVHSPPIVSRLVCANNCRLEVAVTEPVMPPELGENIYLVTATGKMIRITSLDQLKSRVKIGNAAAALSYVRLLTDPSSSILLACPFVELKAQIGMERAAEGSADWVDGFWGYTTNSWMARNDVAPASVVPVERGWIIKRWIALPSEVLSRTIDRIGEYVGKDGTYIRKVISSKRLSRRNYMAFYAPRLE